MKTKKRVKTTYDKKANELVGKPRKAEETIGVVIAIMGIIAMPIIIIPLTKIKERVELLSLHHPLGGGICQSF